MCRVDIVFCSQDSIKKPIPEAILALFTEVYTGEHNLKSRIGYDSAHWYFLDNAFKHI